ncbi:cytochrome C [Desulfobaculum bizertense]|uniref:sulfate respiration complex hexadecaheme cytochrome HmcA n=1 Tax=Desulfobaculum bizertense TaxID=376490 RepID=UPI001F24157A|nr:cytochrome c3 family protein [Desulfobaculum bizertense]UIJ37783.1 cytochrome C [Desulfobaculum bizertense]
MMKGRTLLHWALAVVVLSAISLTGIEASAVSKQATPKDSRAGMLVIDTLSSFGKLDEKAVPFFHDTHTKALAQQGKDCSTCHVKNEKGLLSTTFKGTDGANKNDAKEQFHKNCITCHSERASAGESTGPTEASCRSCHRDAPAQSGRVSAGFDLKLHATHVNSKAIPAASGEKENCSSCHHVYDKKQDKLVYAKGEEGSCRYCHKDTAQDKTVSMQQASHTACVSCHLEKQEQKLATGPVTCEGCHDKAIQDTRKAKTAKTPTPRLMRGQDDAILLTAPGKKAEAGMGAVVFNHKAHEMVVKDCRTCHHEKIESCSKTCHTEKGSKEGGFVTLDQAMHSKTSSASCVGCHNQQKKQKQCAGCHSMIPENKAASEQNCATCHEQDTKKAGAMLKMPKAEKKAAMQQEIATREQSGGTYDLKDIPETVSIDVLADQYNAAQFPHRKIVASMLKGIEGSELANVFHTEKGTFCQGCHHNSPASLNPPRCASCHKDAVNNSASAKPGLKAAYHRQCIGCHEAMDIQKPQATACADCHTERNK